MEDNNDINQKKPQYIFFIIAAILTYFAKKPELFTFALAILGLVVGYVISRKCKRKIRYLYYFLEIVLILALVIIIFVFKDKIPELLRKILFFSLKKPD